MSCVPRSRALKKRPSNAFLTGKLKKRMATGCTGREGRNSFDTQGLVPLIAFASELCLKYLPSREVIEEVVLGYVGLYAETSTREFLKVNAGWLVETLAAALAVVLV